MSEERNPYVPNEAVRLDAKVKKVQAMLKHISRDYATKEQGAVITLVVDEIQEMDLRRIERCYLYGHPVTLSFRFAQADFLDSMGPEAQDFQEGTLSFTSGTPYDSADDMDRSVNPETGELDSIASKVHGFSVGDLVIVMAKGDFEGLQGEILRIYDENTIQLKGAENVLIGQTFSWDQLAPILGETLEAEAWQKERT